MKWPESSIELVARVSSDRGPLWLRKLWATGTTLLYWVFFKVGMKIGRYDANKYRRAVATNSDFRKYDDGLYLTLDCSPELSTAITTPLGVCIQVTSGQVWSFRATKGTSNVHRAVRC